MGVSVEKSYGVGCVGARVRRRRKLTAVVVSLVFAFVAGDLAVAAPSLADPVEEDVAPDELDIEHGDPDANPRELPALESTAAPETEPVTGDFSFRPGGPMPEGWVAPGATGFVEGESVEQPELTTETRKVFENPDGSFTEQKALAPVRFRDQSGQWQEFSGEHVERDGAVVAESAPDGGEIAIDGNTANPVVETPTSAGPVGLVQPDADLSSASVDGKAVTFENSVDGTSDLVVSLLPDGFETTVVLPAPVPGSGTFTQELTVPEGVVARNGGPGVELVGSSGAVIGSYGSGVAFDEAAASVAVSTTLVGQDGGTVTVQVAAPEAWLTDPARHYPVSIDPIFTTPPGAGSGLDTFIQRYSSTNQSAALNLPIGTPSGGDPRRALMKFDLSSIITPDRNVLSASLAAWTHASTTCTAKGVVLQRNATAFTGSTVWANQPAGVGAGLNFSFSKGFSGSCPAGSQAMDVTSMVSEWFGGQPNHGFSIRAASETDASFTKEFTSTESWVAPVLSVTYNNAPVPAQPASPATNTKVATTTPTLAITPGSDVDGNALQYWWAVSTEPGNAGQQVVSGFLPATTVDWTVPAGSLVDGATYYWNVYTFDGLGWPVQGTQRAFSVDLRLGDSGSWPTDELGPAKVNLTNGNLIVNTASPSFNTVGGGMGVAYSYNSQAQSSGGLTGSYYRNPDPLDHEPFSFAEPMAVRRDASPVFNWLAGTPAPGVPSDDFYASWDGYFAAGVAGNYKIGGNCINGGMRVTLHTVSIDRWTAGCSTADTWSAAVVLTAGQIVPIKAEYWHGSGNAQVTFKAQRPSGPGAGFDLPAASLSTKASALPEGWTMSADLDGATAYASAEITSDAATFFDLEGTATRYPYDAAKKAWQPPPGHYGTVGQAKDGAITLLEADGSAYVFETDGRLRSVTSALDNANQAAAQLTWASPGTGAPKRLTTITDPVSGRAITLHYAGSGTCSTGAGAGLSPAPAGRLCAVDYAAFSAGTTYLRYNSSGQLVRIEDPGGEVTDFGYAGGRLDRIRDPLAADAVAAGVRADDDTTKTIVTYTNSKVSSLVNPEPQPGEARPARTYTYDPVAQTAVVGAAGLTSTAGWLRKITFDDLGRPTAEQDQAGRTSFTRYDDEDRTLSSWDDGTNLKSTMVYDSMGNHTDTWGPAPVSWWSAADAIGPPLPGHVADTPRETNRHDEGTQTLAATWWSNGDWSGPPKARGTGVTPGTSELVGSWGTGSPAAVGTTARFSGRFTGYVNFPASGSWEFNVVNMVGTYRMTVDNTSLLDETRTAVSTLAASYNAASAGWKPITIDYSDSPSSTASFSLTWRPGSTGAFVNVPAAALTPGFGLLTSTTDPDGNSSSTTYADPANALATATTVDPAGLALTSTTTYEASGYKREVARTLPLGSGSTIQTSYYNNSESGPVGACTAAGANQGGLTQTITSADPDGSGMSGTAGIRRTTAYDAQGRPAASRVGTEPWTCTTYDARGRTVSTVVPGVSGMIGHTVTKGYELFGNPLVAVVHDVDATPGATPSVVITLSDLLGRTRLYQDAWGNVTTTAYDQVGRVSEISSPVGVESMSYDSDGNPGPTVIDSVTLATPTYDSAGRLDRVVYANGTTSDPIVRDALGRESGLTWRRSSDNAVLATETSTLSLGGKITDLVTDGNDARPGGPNYLYDAAERLTEAWTTTRDSGGVVGSRHSVYGFATAAGTCAPGTQPQAGKNTNRTSLSVDHGAGPATTSYCYDAADRLVSTTEPGVGAVTYDAHGNTSSIWGETRTYDSSDRHVGTSKAGVGVSYRRDGMDRIVSRTSTAGSGSEQRYGFTSNSDSPSLTLDASGTVVERMIGLIGGATVTVRAGAGTWSLPNSQGDIVVVTDDTGVVAGPVRTYDSFGKTTGQPLVDNSAGLADYGWLGKYQRLTEHEAGFAQTVEMGVRQYDPTIGRFLEVDPVEGGSANDYDYSSGDPVNSLDLGGLRRTRRGRGVQYREKKVYGKWKNYGWWVKGPFHYVDGCWGFGPGLCGSYERAQHRTVKLVRTYTVSGRRQTMWTRTQSRIRIKVCPAMSFGPFGFSLKRGCYTIQQYF